MPVSYLGLGSNLDTPERKLSLAVEALRSLPGCHLLRCSLLYRSKPWGVRSQPDYYNLVLQIHTRLPPPLLLKQCQKIEKQLGRVRKKHWGPRTLDIDILLYGCLRINSPKLIIPHPHMLIRDFVLEPLLSIAPDLKLPGGESISNYLTDCSAHIKNRKR